MTIDFFQKGDKVNIVCLWAPRFSTFSAFVGCRYLSIDVPILDSVVLDGLTIYQSIRNFSLVVTNLHPNVLKPWHTFVVVYSVMFLLLPLQSDCSNSLSMDCNIILRKYSIIIFQLNLIRSIKTYVNSIY